MGSTHGGALGEKAITWSDVHILTGLSPAQLQTRGVRVGSAGVPVAVGRGPFLFGDAHDPLIAAWTLDDRAGVMTLLRLLACLKEEAIQPFCPTIIAFVTSEELGGYGAKHLARQAQPECFVAVDGAPIPTGVPLHIVGRQSGARIGWRPMTSDCCNNFAGRHGRTHRIRPFFFAGSGWITANKRMGYGRSPFHLLTPS